MFYKLESKYNLIKKELLKSKEIDPIIISTRIMHMDFINIHGPEHHFLDGGSLLTAYSNYVANYNLEQALDELAERTIKMPGATCGFWGVCGAASSLGAALAVINKTTYLSDDEYYKHNMELTSIILNKMSKIGGPRCCKRNGKLALITAVNYLNDKYNLKLQYSMLPCEFIDKNKDCIKNRCPFYKN